MYCVWRGPFRWFCLLGPAKDLSCPLAHSYPLNQIKNAMSIDKESMNEGNEFGPQKSSVLVEINISCPVQHSVGNLMTLNLANNKRGIKVLWLGLTQESTEMAFHREKHIHQSTVHLETIQCDMTGLSAIPHEIPTFCFALKTAIYATVYPNRQALGDSKLLWQYTLW